jgi:hypothetical protein
MADTAPTLLATTAIFKSSVNLECADDAEASDEAKKLVDGYDVELWQRNRMVANGVWISIQSPP